MSDMPEQTIETTEPVQPQRVFKTGATRIVEDDSMRGLTVAQVQQLLKSTYPEIANATVRETMNADGQKIVDFLPLPGRKG